MVELSLGCILFDVVPDLLVFVYVDVSVLYFIAALLSALGYSVCLWEFSVSSIVG